MQHTLLHKKSTAYSEFYDKAFEVIPREETGSDHFTTQFEEPKGLTQTLRLPAIVYLLDVEINNIFGL
jgi:hypothetical protein